MSSFHASNSHGWTLSVFVLYVNNYVHNNHPGAHFLQIYFTHIFPSSFSSSSIQFGGLGPADGQIFMLVLKGCFGVPNYDSWRHLKKYLKKRIINYICLKTQVQFDTVSLNKVFLPLFSTICWKHKGAYRIHGFFYPVFSIFAGAASKFDAVLSRVFVLLILSFRRLL